MIVLQVAVFVVTLDPLSVIPLFFFAATLIFIGIDLMLEWLLEVREGARERGREGFWVER